MKWLIIILVVVLLFIIVLVQWKPKQEEQDLSRLKSKSPSKKIIWLMVDSLMYQAVEQGIRHNELPALSFLIRHGQYHKEVVSSFPTMSVTIDSTVLTGTYPDQHKVPGLIWYDQQEKRVVNYGTALGEAFKNGMNQALEDALIHLNGKHLNPQVPTLYEELAAKNIPTGSVNGMIYRGKTNHFLTFPPWLSAATSLPGKQPVKGPDFFAFGSFSNPLRESTAMPEGITDSLGFSDSYPVEVTRYLIKENRLPGLLFVYLSDNDMPLHKKGPSERSGLKKFDRELQSLLDSFGSWEKALKETVWIITGDSGQTGLKADKEEAVIRLDQLLNRYQQLATGEKATEDTEIVLCVNERMAYIYLLQPSIRETELISLLKQDERIDLITWREKDWIHVLNRDKDLVVRFRPGDQWKDPYNQSWEIQGNAQALDIQTDDKQHTLLYGDFPDPFSRLWGAFHSHPGRFMIVNAKPGYELAIQPSPTHPGGGGHGSLHKTDSMVPLIITGTSLKPPYKRLVDLKKFVIQQLTQTP